MLKKKLARLAHPALLIVVLCVVYTLTIGRNPHGGPTPEDLALDAPAYLSDTPVAVSARYAAADAAPAGASVDAVAGEAGARAGEPVGEVNRLSRSAAEPQDVRADAKPEGARVAQPAAGGGGSQSVQPADQKPPALTVYTHTVRSGETLTDIARLYGVDIDTIIAANAIADPNRIRAGEKLTVPNMNGVLHTVQRGESLWSIANYYEVTIDEIVAANGIKNPNSLQVGQQLIIPGAQALVAARQKEALISPTGQLLRNFSWPVTGRISSRFGERWGRMHYGLDIAVPTGTPVRAAAAGRVTFAGTQGGYGLLVKIDHGNGIETRYAHNSKIVVKVGQTVKRGDVIAYSGSSGNSTGPHVHFEIRRNGAALDPLDYLR